MGRKTKMGQGTPWSAPDLTRAQRACLARHGIQTVARTVMDAEGNLWEPATDGGRNAANPTRSHNARSAARAEWNAGVE